jgi:protein TonB
MSTHSLTTPRDGRPLGWALALAVLVHVAALFLPVWRPAPPAPLAVDPTPPRIVPAGPWLDPPPESPRTASPSRTIPSPRQLEPAPAPVSLEPVSDAAPTFDATVHAVPAAPLVGAVAPPPAAPPAIVDESAEGLVLPQPFGARAQPSYPEVARVARRGGRVILSAVVGAEGEIESLEVISAPTPDLGFADAAIDAVRSWRYRPGLLGGRPVAVRLTVVVEFTLR